MSEKMKIPGWFWAVTILLLLWNIMGILSFIGSINSTYESLIESGMYNSEQAELMMSFPSWTKFIYIAATATGLIGAISLILKRSLALPFFIISLVLAAFHHIYIYASTDALSIMGGLDKTMSVVVIGLCLLQVWFSRFSINKRWLQ